MTAKKSQPFNEDSRVKIPALVHLTRLGYEYIPLRDYNWDLDTNIFPSIFEDSMKRINPEIDDHEIKRMMQDIDLSLENEDLGRQFYDMLTETSGHDLIDFQQPENNAFHICTELPYVFGEEEFRPDITVLVNGMPLVFIEVKKPNNRDGVIAERVRMNRRFQNRKFRKFINITQMMIFSNNAEYNTDVIEPIEGAFYCASSYKKAVFSYFREEQQDELNQQLHSIDDKVENKILRDNGLISIKHTDEFKTNKHPQKSPTNRICTSLLTKERLLFILKYAIAYVEEENGLQKHLMRYPQIFATKAITAKLDKTDEEPRGIIWHTQGSGKTALAYYNVKHLTDYYQQKNIIPKFYFIVDRLDLLQQAKSEFIKRRLKVHVVNSRDEFVKDIKTTTAIHNTKGEPEITVVNIHKFSEDSNVVDQQDYNINIQRVYFLDEVHRSYNPEGSFLANLTQSDPNAVMIGLTGTPLIGGVKSRVLFGDYIHKYYYNMSIADGYTLRLIREEIKTSSSIKLNEVLKKLEVEKGEYKRKKMYAHENYVEPMLDLIIQNFEESRRQHTEADIGAMVICHSSDQAKMMFEIFQSKYMIVSSTVESLPIVAEEPGSYVTAKQESYKVNTAALILHDIGTKEDREAEVNTFKAGDTDILFVYNMLLTGFSAPRLKKLYIGRVIKSHNLLQALTRVNRPFNKFEYGYVVDFVDIRKEFDITNKAYYDELNNLLGDNFGEYNQIFKPEVEIIAEIKEVKELISQYNTTNKEIFSQQIRDIKNQTELSKIAKVLNNTKSLYNIIRFQGQYEFLEQLDFKLIPILAREVEGQLAKLRQAEALKKGNQQQNLLNMALADTMFMFQKIGEEELVLADKLKEFVTRANNGLNKSIDKKDPEFINLYDELARIMQKGNIENLSQEAITENLNELQSLIDRIQEYNRLENLLKDKYDNDHKYVRIHKRLRERGEPDCDEQVLTKALNDVKAAVEEQILQQEKILDQEGFFESFTLREVVQQFKNQHQVSLTGDIAKYINNIITEEYINEYKGIEAA